MSFHVNFSGEVGPCSAKTACPFGDLETDHFTTEEQAQKAYDEAMKGKNFTSFRKKEAHFTALADEDKAEKKERKAYLRRLKKMKTPKTLPPEAPQAGHFEEITSIHQLRKGLVLDDGKEILRVRTVKGEKLAYYRGKNSPPGAEAVLSQTDLDLAPLRRWKTSVDPELEKVYEMEKLEHKIENLMLNYTDFKRSRLLRESVAYTPSRDYYQTKDFLARLKVLKETAEKFEKAQVPYPYARALKAAEDYVGNPYTEMGSRRMLEIFLNGLNAPSSSALYRTYDNGAIQNLLWIYDDNAAPHLSRNVEQEWEDRVSNKLL